jgi:hypothetical protein
LSLTIKTANFLIQQSNSYSSSNACDGSRQSTGMHDSSRPLLPLVPGQSPPAVPHGATKPDNSSVPSPVHLYTQQHSGESKGRAGSTRAHPRPGPRANHAPAGAAAPDPDPEQPRAAAGPRHGGSGRQPRIKSGYEQPSYKSPGPAPSCWPHRN